MRRLFLAPALALCLALGITFMVTFFWATPSSEWVLGIIKSISFYVVYLSVLYFIEGNDLYASFKKMIGFTTLYSRVKKFLKRK